MFTKFNQFQLSKQQQVTVLGGTGKSEFLSVSMMPNSQAQANFLAAYNEQHSSDASTLTSSVAPQASITNEVDQMNALNRAQMNAYNTISTVLSSQQQLKQSIIARMG